LVIVQGGTELWFNPSPSEALFTDVVVPVLYWYFAGERHGTSRKAAKRAN
jgi:hypothetical protein